MGTNRTCQPCCGGGGSDELIYPGTSVACITWKSRPAQRTIGRFALEQIDKFIDIVNDNSLEAELLEEPTDSLFDYYLNDRFMNLNVSLMNDDFIIPGVIAGKTYFECKYSVASGTQFNPFSVPNYSPFISFGYSLYSRNPGTLQTYFSFSLPKGIFYGAETPLELLTLNSWESRYDLLQELSNLIYGPQSVNSFMGINNARLLILILNDESTMWSVEKVQEFLSFGNGKKRLFIASNNNNNCANLILEGIGSSIRINSTEKIHVESTDENDFATVDGSHYLLNGINYFITRGAKTVSGGTEVLDYGGDNIMSIEKVGNAEIVVYGGFDGLCRESVSPSSINPTEIDLSAPFPPLEYGPSGIQLIKKNFPEWEFGNWTKKGGIKVINLINFFDGTYHMIPFLLLRMANLEVL